MSSEAIMAPNHDNSPLAGDAPDGAPASVDRARSPRVSILGPAYNPAPFLNRAVRSALPRTMAAIAGAGPTAHHRRPRLSAPRSRGLAADRAARVSRTAGDRVGSGPAHLARLLLLVQAPNARSPLGAGAGWLLPVLRQPELD